MLDYWRQCSKGFRESLQLWPETVSDCEGSTSLDALPSPAPLSHGPISSWLSGTLAPSSHLLIDGFHQLHKALQAF